MIRFACPGCSATFTVDDNKGGKTGKCPKCHSEFQIPAAELASEPPPLPRSAPSPAADEAVEIKPCPKCRTQLTVMVSDLGLDVECPDCTTVFKAERSRSSSSRTSAEQPSRRRDADDDEDRPAPVAVAEMTTRMKKIARADDGVGDAARPRTQKRPSACRER